MKTLLALVFIFASYLPPCFAEPVLGKKELLLSNEKVELVRLTYPPGAESGMHTHHYAHRTVYFVKGGLLQLIPQNPEQPSKTLKVNDGDVLFLPATTHNVRNIGDSVVVIIENEIK